MTKQIGEPASKPEPKAGIWEGCGRSGGDYRSLPAEWCREMASGASGVILGGSTAGLQIQYASRVPHQPI